VLNKERAHGKNPKIHILKSISWIQNFVETYAKQKQAVGSEKGEKLCAIFVELLFI
jgi:hypothetical protein